MTEYGDTALTEIIYKLTLHMRSCSHWINVDVSQPSSYSPSQAGLLCRPCGSVQRSEFTRRHTWPLSSLSALADPAVLCSERSSWGQAAPRQKPHIARHEAVHIVTSGCKKPWYYIKLYSQSDIEYTTHMSASVPLLQSFKCPLTCPS